MCAAFGVSPKTGHKWLHQFEAAGPAGLQDRSRRPKSNSRAISLAMADRLVELRCEERVNDHRPHATRTVTNLSTPSHVRDQWRRRLAMISFPGRTNLPRAGLSGAQPSWRWATANQRTGPGPQTRNGGEP
ncbi:MAG: helix-turn-helix domain-containing protein [Deltaproteobacteria bacterium]|nr:MAG: helix-turn-helix domain-containing protein [Deltaproteobacteria bacterium]